MNKSNQLLGGFLSYIIIISDTSQGEDIYNKNPAMAVDYAVDGVGGGSMI